MRISETGSKGGVRRRRRRRGVLVPPILALPSSLVRASLLLLFVTLPIGGTIAFLNPTTSAFARQKTHFSTTTSSSASVEGTPQTLGGVSDFESWFPLPLPSTVRHGAFQGGELRGLEYTGEKEAMDGKAPLVLRVPKSVVLRSSMEEKNWDVKLALRLLEEWRKGKGSNYYGYCSLLTRGTPYAASTTPPSTAPDALRNWTPAQRSPLSDAPSGEKLLKALKSQTSRWVNHYDNVLTNAEKKDVTLDQFIWALEAVHSRAFKGTFGNEMPGQWNNVLGILTPLSAAAIGANYLLLDSSITSDSGEVDNSVFVTVALGLVAMLPVLFNAIMKEEDEAVLLPLIDSANHLQDADSSIEYDPLKSEFTVALGPKCFVKDKSDGTTQIYVSYGERTDGELMLNYGFLPGLGVGGGREEGSGDEVEAGEGWRRRLVEEFLRRNP